MIENILAGIIVGTCAAIAYHAARGIVGSHRRLVALPGLVMLAVLVLGLGIGFIARI